jgi:hypothetical protein
VPDPNRYSEPAEAAMEYGTGLKLMYYVRLVREIAPWRVGEAEG